MHLPIFLTASAALASCGLALTIPQNVEYVIHEKRDQQHLSSTLTKRSPAAGNAMLPFRIGLTQRDLHLGYDRLMDVSHPESKNYGKHWTAAEVNKFFAPTAETVQTVRDWLIQSGIASHRISVSDNKGWLAFDATVAEAEELFRAQYYEHEHHSDENKVTIGCDDYSLPKHVTAHVDFIQPAVKHAIFRRTEQTLKKRSIHPNFNPPSPPVAPILGPGGPTDPGVSVDVKVVPVNCSSFVVDGDCIRALYNMPAQNSNRQVSGSNALSVWESGENYDKADLKLWFKSFAPYIPPNTIPEMSSIDGGEGPVPERDAGTEALLDIVIAYELIYPQTVNVFSADDTYSADNDLGFMDTTLDALDGSFCTYSAFGQKGDNNTIDPVYPDPHAGGYKGPLMCGTYTPPNVLSVSYTEGEQYLPVNYVQRQCNEWMKLGLQGTTALFASGDHGVSAYPGSYGNENGCLNTTSGSPTVFSPSVWNGCPYVLSVGATTIKPNVSGLAGGQPEEAVYYGYADEIPYTSGAGFSNVFARPDYQDSAVKAYFQTYDPGYPYYSTTKGQNIGNGGIYNRHGRAYPDVSANGAWTYLYDNGTLIREGGTSMATPLVASIINLINEERIAAGKSPVGFVNPTFYANPGAFNDVVVGSNQGCGLTNAFYCAPGWDPPTGLGTPDYKKLLAIFMAMQ